MAAALLLVLAVAAVTCSSHGAATSRRGRDAGRGTPQVLHLRGEALAVADLQIGTEPGKANVVSGFEVVGTWGSGDDLAASVPPNEASTNFYIRATGGSLQWTRATLAPANLPHLATYLEGELAKQLREQGQVNLRPDEERRLSVAYDCRSQGEATLTLTMEFEGLSPVEIPFKKTCGGEKNTALTVTAGTARDGEQVVIMGVPKWDELKVVGVRPTSTLFTVFVDPLSEKGAQVISTPTATGIGACSARAAPQNAFNGGKKNLAAGEAVDVATEYRCFRHGKCIVTAEVSFFPDMAPYQPLRWSWTKLCGGEALGIDVALPEESRLLATDGASNTSMATPWIAEKNVTGHKVRVVNDETRSLESQVKIRFLNVKCLDTKRCSIRLAEKVPEFLLATSPLDLNVQYDCHSTGSSMVQLTLATEGHDPVVATWAKDCSAFSDSLLGVVLVMVCVGTCFSCACVGFMKLFFEPAMNGKGKPYLEGEFIEDENLSPEELKALDHYEGFYALQKGAASIEQVKDSALGVAGWAAKGPVQQPEGGIGPLDSSS